VTLGIVNTVLIDSTDLKAFQFSRLPHEQIECLAECLFSPLRKSLRRKVCEIRAAQALFLLIALFRLYHQVLGL